MNICSCSVATSPPSASRQGFTRLELAAVLGALALLALLALPALANTKARSQRVVCANNLSRLGQAFAAWSADHGGSFPIEVSWWDSGTRAVGIGSSPPGTIPPPWLAAGLGYNAYWQFYWLREELRTPAVLACPSDDSRRVATSFDSSPAGGLLHANYQNRAVSYILGHPSREAGRAVLSGDRNLTGFTSVGGCSFFGANVRSLPVQGTTTVAWSQDIHPDSGNLLFNDGSVAETDTPGLRQAVAVSDDAGAFHYLTP